MVPVAFSKTVALPGTAVPLFSEPTLARRFWLRAAKVAGANAGNVYVGDSQVSAANQQMALEPGDYWEPPYPDHRAAEQALDLSKVYIDAVTANDGVVGGFIPA
jgi:hypothetical protein